MYPVKQSARAHARKGTPGHERFVHAREPQTAPDAGRASPARPGRTQQADRTRATRREVIGCGQTAFSRSKGFEGARLEDIAAGARYTRGAFYANIDSKEDIFFAIFEEWVRERIESLASAVHRHSDTDEKLGALRTHYAALAKDRRLVLISMEFKLFALRHPEAHARLRSRHRRIRASLAELFTEIMGALGRELPIAYPAASACLGGRSRKAYFLKI